MDFTEERRQWVEQLKTSKDLRGSAIDLLRELGRKRYTYGFDWLGLPIIQVPADMIAVQELIWRIRPEVVVETGVARGGSLALSASILELLGGDREVIGIDIDIRPANRAAIEAHPLARRITLVEGSSIDDAVVKSVFDRVGGRRPVLVLLDSNHTHDHVLRELERYAPLVGAGSYIVVFDTIIDLMPADYFPNRPWGPGDNPKTAVEAFLADNDRFVVDEDIEARLMTTTAIGGYLRCVRD